MELETRTRIYLVRHGQVVGAENIPVYGHTDVGLSDMGRYQMERLAERLRFVELDCVFASDLKRSFESAQIIGAFHDVPIRKMLELRELYLGKWEGLTLSQLRQDYPNELLERQNNIVDFRPPGNGETLREFSIRIYSAVDKILSEFKGKEILIVGHGAVNRVIIARYLGLDLSLAFRLAQDYGCLNILDIYDEKPLLRLLNG